jgi:hypothetical protein
MKFTTAAIFSNIRRSVMLNFLFAMNYENYVIKNFITIVLTAKTKSIAVTVYIFIKCGFKSA